MASTRWRLDGQRALVTGASAGIDPRPGVKLIFWSPGARVAPLTPSAGNVIDRPAARQNPRISFSHLVPSLPFMSWSYQTATVLALAPAFSTQIAT